MIISSAVFVSSSPDVRRCPEQTLPEFAFIGRSNVGKSSLINMLCGRKGLAKVSSAPGKTRLINHFLINDSWYLVDLPGFGYAKLAKTERMKLEAIIQGYFLHRKNLNRTFLLVDSRHEPQKNDLSFISWLHQHSIPYTMIFTKSDKLSKSETLGRPMQYKKQMYSITGFSPEIILTSSVDRSGREEILKQIEELIIF